MNRGTVLQRLLSSSIAGLSFTLLVLAGNPAAAVATPPPPSQLKYLVHRDKLPIGTHDVRFEQDGDRLIVKTETKISVEVFFVTVYRFEQRRTEVLEDGRVVNFESWTNNNGEELHVTATATDAGLEIDGAEGKFVTDPKILPTTYWDVATVKQHELLEGTYGELIEVEISDGVRETLQTTNGPVVTKHYQMRGGLTRDLWYDEKGLWRRMKFEIYDGSVITYELR